MDDLDKNPYVLDILSQPQALRGALAKTDFTPLGALVQALKAGRFDRILLTGMGASYYGLYPAWLHLAAAGLPAIWVDAAELVHHAPALVTERTLLWIASQSGRSAEIVSLLRQSEAHPPAGLLAMTNDLSSPLAQAARRQDGVGFRALLPLHAEPESTPSTRTYLHTLAIGQLAALSLAQAELAPHLAALQIYRRWHGGLSAGLARSICSDWERRWTRSAGTAGIPVDRPGRARPVIGFRFFRGAKLARSCQAARPGLAGSRIPPRAIGDGWARVNRFHLCGRGEVSSKGRMINPWLERAPGN